MERISRRLFFVSAAGGATSFAAVKPMTPMERVGAALNGKEPDRTPFTFWHHFGLESEGPSAHALATLEFQKKFKLDVVKVMSDFPYPKGKGANWWELKEERNPFPKQVQALEMVRDGLARQKPYLETLFNPWNVAGKLSSKAEVLRLKQEKPQALLDALEAIAKSEANHAKLAISQGCNGIFLAIDNAQTGILTPEEYQKFSEPFDRIVLDAVKMAPMNTLHLHGDKVYLDHFAKGWPASIISYSAHSSGVDLAAMRKKFGGVLMAGLDERNIRTLERGDLKRMFVEGRTGAGRKWICAPGCSVPDDSKDSELSLVSQMFGV